MRLIITLLGLSLVMACAKSIPDNNRTAGILVLPVYASSPYKNPFSYRYIISLDKSPSELLITPNVSQNFAILEGLVPGKYTMTGITAHGRRNYSTFSSSRMKPTKLMNLEFTIEAGHITVLNQAFFVQSNIVRFNERADDSWNFAKIGNIEFQQVYSTLSDRGYLEQWSISNSSPNAFASR